MIAKGRKAAVRFDGLDDDKARLRRFRQCMAVEPFVKSTAIGNARDR